MRTSTLLILLIFLFLSHSSSAQDKAIVLQNSWNNELNNYNPKDFLDKLFDLLKVKLNVRSFIAEPQSLTTARKDERWENQVKEQIKSKKLSVGNAYFISLSNDLRLPTFNLGKFLFKNPPRSSKLTFTLHVYDSTGTEVIGDTIINRGCLVKTIDQEKGSKSFYSDYNNFMKDMLCHVEVIRKTIQEKPLSKKQKIYMEAR